MGGLITVFNRGDMTDEKIFEKSSKKVLTWPKK